MRTFSEPYFPVYEQNRIHIFPYMILRFCPYSGKYGYDLLNIREKYGTEKIHILGYFTQSEIKEFYKRIEANLKMVIGYI